MLRGVVENGSGERARVPGYTVAGKTGTAEKVDPETGLYGGGYVSSFIGFAPAEDPEYLALIVLDDPQTTYWGELTAAPAFAEVMDFTLKYFNVPPDSRKITAEVPSPRGRRSETRCLATVAEAMGGTLAWRVGGVGRSARLRGDDRTRAPRARGNCFSRSRAAWTGRTLPRRRS
jgi:membrane peptidoglycan carboxypeptidase